MTRFKSIISLVLVKLALAASASTEKSTGCGEVNIIFTGLPPYHPLVEGQGFDPAAVDAGLREDAANVVKAGYNSRVVLIGPEQPLNVLAGRMDDHHWDGTGVGYGVRGSHLENLTTRFQETIQLYRDREPLSPIVFDYSYTTAVWAIQQQFPLSSNCTDKPGQDLGFEIYCDICSQ